MKTGTASCGLKYAVRSSGGQAACCSLTVKAGKAFEGDLPAGTAHFLEHTIFKGTARRSAVQINSRLDLLGGELNAYTTKEEIVLHATVLREDLPTAVDLLLELATSATFPQKELDVERGVVIDEIHSCKDDPADDVYDNFEEMLFAGHPLGRRILGTPASVRKIRRSDLLGYLHERFVPGRMALAVVTGGDEAKAEAMVLRLCGKYFPEDLPSGVTGGADAGSQVRTVIGAKELPPFAPGAAAPGPFAPGTVTPSVPDLPPFAPGAVASGAPDLPPFTPAAPFCRTVDKRNHEVNVVLGATAPSLYSGKDRITAAVLAGILGGPGANSLLNAYLREKKGWVYGVECSYTQYSVSGIMAVSLGCERENLESCLAAVRRIISGLCEKPLSERKMAQARKQLLGQFGIASDNAESQCLSMGKSMLAFGRVASDGETRAAVESVSAADILDMAVRVLTPDRLSSLVYL